MISITYLAVSVLRSSFVMMFSRIKRVRYLCSSMVQFKSAFYVYGATSTGWCPTFLFWVVLSFFELLCVTIWCSQKIMCLIGENYVGDNFGREKLFPTLFFPKRYSSTDLEVQLMQLNHCDGVLSLFLRCLIRAR